jgi:hypothetical protein
MSTSRPDNPFRDYTYRDRHLSLWQSAARSVSRKTSTFLLRAKDLAADTLEERLMAPVNNLYSRVAGGGDSGRFLMAFSSQESVTKDCAELAARFLAA